jgi:hypothetical protein
LATVCWASARPAAAGLVAWLAAAELVADAGADADAAVLAGPLVVPAGAWLLLELHAVTSAVTVNAVPAVSQYLGLSFIAFPSATSPK